MPCLLWTPALWNCVSLIILISSIFPDLSFWTTFVNSHMADCSQSQCAELLCSVLWGWWSWAGEKRHPKNLAFNLTTSVLWDGERWSPRVIGVKFGLFEHSGPDSTLFATNRHHLSPLCQETEEANLLCCSCPFSKVNFPNHPCDLLPNWQLILS